MDVWRVTVIKATCAATLSQNETVAKQKMTGVAALQSYLGNSFTYWHYSGRSFSAPDKDALLHLKNENETQTQSQGKEMGNVTSYGFLPAVTGNRKVSEGQ